MRLVTITDRRRLSTALSWMHECRRGIYRHTANVSLRFTLNFIFWKSYRSLQIVVTTTRFII